MPSLSLRDRKNKSILYLHLLHLPSALDTFYLTAICLLCPASLLPYARLRYLPAPCLQPLLNLLQVRAASHSTPSHLPTPCGLSQKRRDTPAAPPLSAWRAPTSIRRSMRAVARAKARAYACAGGHGRLAGSSPPHLRLAAAPPPPCTPHYTLRIYQHYGASTPPHYRAHTAISYTTRTRLPHPPDRRAHTPTHRTPPLHTPPTAHYTHCRLHCTPPPPAHTYLRTHTHTTPHCTTAAPPTKKKKRTIVSSVEPLGNTSLLYDLCCLFTCLPLMPLGRANHKHLCLSVSNLNIHVLFCR